MANQRHLKKLKNGIIAWNQWRKEHPDIIPDLHEADLREANLRGADLRGTDLIQANLTQAHLTQANLSFANLNEADLNEADLRGADLRRADLREADLREADLTQAHLTQADLRGTDLREADLIQAHLTQAHLSFANLSGANLNGADLSWALCYETIFANVDLQTVKGLETITHNGPSSIDVRTLYHSQGNIPETFLKGVGIGDTFLSYIRSLTNTPIQYYSCFISYSTQDEPFAKRLYADLQSQNVRCWFAPEDLKIGDHYHQRIDDSIRIYEKLILILSQHAVQSAWVEREVVAAREKEDHKQQQVLFPIRLDNAVMDTSKAWAADVRRRWHIGDLTQWKDHDAYQTAFTRLLRDLKAQSS